MKARITAWIVVLGVIWGAWHLVGKWRNPWQAAVPVTAVMPSMPGCSKECTE